VEAAPKSGEQADPWDPPGRYGIHGSARLEGSKRIELSLEHKVAVTIITIRSTHLSNLTWTNRVFTIVRQNRDAKPLTPPPDSGSLKVICSESFASPNMAVMTAGQALRNRVSEILEDVHAHKLAGSDYNLRS
jgi:hypothetical protein